MPIGGLKALYNLILKDAIKGSGGVSGIMSIGDSVRALAQKRFQSYVMSAQKQGVDLDRFSEGQLKYMLEMNKAGNKVKMKQAPSIKKDNVIEGKFGKSFKEEIEDMDKKPEDMADGGRIGFKKGMDRRTFMKIMGGLTALPVVGKFFKGAEVAAPVVEKAVDVASGAPPYFFNLVDRIRALGKKFGGPKERSESYIYKDYEMDIDLDTGKIDIKKTKEAMIPGGDEAGVAEEVYMTYKPGVADETTKGRKVVDEYEEFTARPDIDGKMKDVEDGVPDEVVREGSIGKEELEQEIIEQVAREKKASGGLAYMLGE